MGKAFMENCLECEGEHLCDAEISPRRSPAFGGFTLVEMTRGGGMTWDGLIEKLRNRNSRLE